MKFTSKKQKNVVNEVKMTSDEIADFKNKLFAGEVRFKFTKKDGTLREARGTTSPNLLPPPPPERQYDNNALQRARPTRIKPANIICFYDLDAQGWRSFDSNRFEGIVE